MRALRALNSSVPNFALRAKFVNDTKNARTDTLQKNHKFYVDITSWVFTQTPRNLHSICHNRRSSCLPIFVEIKITVFENYRFFVGFFCQIRHFFKFHVAKTSWIFTQTPRNVHSTCPNRRASRLLFFVEIKIIVFEIFGLFPVRFLGALRAPWIRRFRIPRFAQNSSIVGEILKIIVFEIFVFFRFFFA